MPYSFDLLDEEQQKKKDAGADQLGAPSMTGGGQQFGGGSAAPTSTAQGAAPSGTNTQGSGFISLDKYMKANTGNTLGKQVTGNVQGAVDQGKQALDQGSQDFTKASNQGTVKWNNVGSDVGNIVDNAGAGTTAADAQKIKDYSNASYQGPDSFLGTSYGTQAQGAAQKANQQAKALQTEGGRFALLDQYFGRPTYNSGQKSLDNLLVQNDRGTAARAQNINTQANNLSTTGIQKTKDLDTLAVANKAATQDAAKNTRDYLTNASQAFKGTLDDQLAAAKGTYGQKYASAQKALSGNTYDPDVYSGLGLTKGQQIYGVDPTAYLSAGVSPNLFNSASEQQYAKAKALAQLAGLDDSTLLPSADLSQAGKASPYRFDSAAFNNAVNGVKSTTVAGLQKDFSDSFNKFVAPSGGLLGGAGQAALAPLKAAYQAAANAGFSDQAKNDAVTALMQDPKNVFLQSGQGKDTISKWSALSKYLGSTLGTSVKPKVTVPIIKKS
jgi:hypothetical protein